MIENQQFDGRFAQVGAANAPLTITLEAPTLGTIRNGFAWLHWSYNAAPTNGQITIVSGELSYTIFITAAGPGFLPFDQTVFRPGEQVVITLAAGGAAVRGSLAILGAKVT